MAQPSLHSGAGIASILRGPWGVYLAALALTLTGFVGMQNGVGALHAGGILAGLIAAGCAIAWRLQAASLASFKERAQSAMLVSLSGLLVFFDSLLLPARVNPEGALPGSDAALGVSDWNSAYMLFCFLIMVAVVASVLLLLPSLGRRIAISFLLLLHFGGILTAVTSVEPPGSSAPWLAMQAWTRFYRPYLSFMYLNNAYHFYSPEPGPPTLLWFYIRYADNRCQWVKVPSRSDSPLPLNYQRLLALTESTNQMGPPTVADAAFNAKYRDRFNAGARLGIPLHPIYSAANQYRVPQEYSKMMISAYARFAARHFKHLTDPSIPVTGVRVYKVIHQIINAPELAIGYSPLEKSLYLAYFMGEFDTAGDMVNKDDPFLYWLLPIYDRTLETHPELAAQPATTKRELDIVDCLDIHKDLWSQTAEPEKVIQ